MKAKFRKWIESKKSLLQWELHKEYYEIAKKAIKEKDEQFFEAFDAFLKSNSKQKDELIEQVLGKKPADRDSFVVGEEFNSLSCGENFTKKVLGPDIKTVIQVNVFGDSFIKEFVLPKKDMNDLSIQKRTDSSPMEREKFWAVLKLLTKNPKRSKKILKYELDKEKFYLLHVKLSLEEIFAVRLVWDGTKWFIRGRDFYYPNASWLEGDIFLYLS